MSEVKPGSWVIIKNPAGAETATAPPAIRVGRGGSLMRMTSPQALDGCKAVVEVSERDTPEGFLVVSSVGAVVSSLNMQSEFSGMCDHLGPAGFFKAAVHGSWVSAVAMADTPRLSALQHDLARDLSQSAEGVVALGDRLTKMPSLINFFESDPVHAPIDRPLASEPAARIEPFRAGGADSLAVVTIEDGELVSKPNHFAWSFLSDKIGSLANSILSNEGKREADFVQSLYQRAAQPALSDLGAALHGPLHIFVAVAILIMQFKYLPASGSSQRQSSISLDLSQPDALGSVQAVIESLCRSCHELISALDPEALAHSVIPRLMQLFIDADQDCQERISVNQSRTLMSRLADGPESSFGAGSNMAAVAASGAVLQQAKRPKTGGESLVVSLQIRADFHACYAACMRL
jgi:hypothetical protein